MSEIAQLLEDRAQYQEQLDLVLGSLTDDPENAELVALRDELKAALEIIDESVGALQPDVKPAKAQPEDATDAPAVFKVNENVQARWVTGDKGWYAARIMSVTGSAMAPMYTVKFRSYDTIETLRARDIRPLVKDREAKKEAKEPKDTKNKDAKKEASAKRKADDMAAGGTHGSAHTASPAPPAPLAPTQPTQPTQATPPPPPGQSFEPEPSVVAPAPPPPPPSAQAPPPAPAPTAQKPLGTRTIDRFSAGMVSSGEAQLYQPVAASQPQPPATSGFRKFGSATPVLGEEPPPKKFKKIKATKQLEAGKSKWQEFSTKGKTGKGVKKDSMFRTPEGATGRVGFIGSGQAMRKDATRSRHVYQTNDDLD